MVTVALLSGILGAVAPGALASARQTAPAYGRYLASINASDVFVNVPGVIPGGPATRPIQLISRLPGITASSAYLGLDAYPVIRGVGGVVTYEMYQFNPVTYMSRPAGRRSYTVTAIVDLPPVLGD